MTRTLVIADDERGVREFCKQEFEAIGYRVFLASDGNEVIDIVDTFCIDLAILDEHMPRCSGLEAARRIKHWHPHLPVILFTADEYYAWTKSPVVDAAILKSENLCSLTSTVAQLLNKSPTSPVGSESTRCRTPITSK